MNKLIIFYYKYIHLWYLSIEDTSIDLNRSRGKFRVKYSDNQLSQPFIYKVAKSYQSIFGGEIIYFSK